MPDDPIEEHFAEKRAEDERTTARAYRLSAGMLAAGVAILAYEPTGVLFGMLGQAFSLARDHVNGRPLQELTNRVTLLEDRVAIGESAPQGTRVTGERAQLLARTAQVELQTLWALLSVEEALAEFGWTPRTYRVAAEELEHLGLVDAHAGFRTALTEDAILRVGPTLFPAIDWRGDVARILAVVGREDEAERVVLSQELVTEVEIPVPRFALLVRNLVALGYIDGDGSGGDTWGYYYELRMTSHGRRVARGDDPVF